MDDGSHDRQHIVDRLARPMFTLSVLFVLLLGALIVVRVDMPRVAELAELERLASGAGMPLAPVHAADERDRLVTSDRLGDLLLGMLLALWPLFWLDYLVTLRHEPHRPLSRRGLSRLLACLAPPWRLATPSGARDDCVWLPGLGWQRPGRPLARRLERASSKPMLLIALLILPVLLIEFGFGALVDRHAWLRLLLHVSTGLIWCAFAIEFCVLCGATDRKLDHVRRNWIDLAIVLLPLISFLRSVRALRLARLARVQKLARMGRIYRMRGLLMKAVRALMLLDAVGRLFRITPERRLVRLRRRRDELQEDLDELELDISSLEQGLVEETLPARA